MPRRRCGCALHGESYLQVSRLSFLDARPLPLSGVVAQAVRVQPNDGRALDAGRQTHLAGDVDAAFEHYRQHPDARVAPTAAGAVVGKQLPAADFVAELDPDCAATDLVLAAYNGFGTEEDLIAIAEHAEKATLTESESLSRRDSARRWRQVSVVNRSLKRYDKATECATRAYELSPNDFWVRFGFGVRLFRIGSAYAEADPHLVLVPLAAARTCVTCSGRCRSRPSDD